MFLESKKHNLKKITAIALAVLFLDQVVKFVVVNNIFFEIEVYKNYNALFGLPVDFGLVLVLFIFLILVVASPPFKKGAGGISSNKELSSEASELSSLLEFKIALALILGGILGNLTDRFFYGYIIDYLNFFNLFIFNIADLAICFGALLISWKVLRK